MNTDVVVVGAGPAGLSSAIHLARCGHAVTLIARSRAKGLPVGEQLSGEGVRELAQLDARLVTDRFGMISPTTLSAWGEPTVRARSDLFDAWGASCIVQRAALERALSEVACEAGVELVRGESLRLITHTGDRVRIALGSGRTIEAAFVVDATGRSAHVARQLGGRILRYDALVGLAGPLEGSSSMFTREVLIESVSNGWWYSAPTGDHSLLSIYFTDADLLQADGASAHFRTALAESTHTRARAGACGVGGAIDVRPAGSQRLDRAAGDRWLAVGDAAMAWDPLSAAGLTRALQEGRQAASVIQAVFAGDGARALAGYVEHVQRAFARYLATRLQFYRVETRHADSRFWQRHQQRPASAAAIRLAPDARLKSGEQSQVADLLAPGLDRTRVLGILAAGATRARDIVGALREQTGGAYLGEELIGVVQRMLDEGTLRQDAGAF